VDQAPTGIQPDPRAEPFYAGALRRIVRILLVLAVLLPAGIWWRYGFATAAGFFLGAAVSWLNFKSLVRGVEGLMERIVEAHSRERGASIVLRFLLRYVLVGIVAYAIFRGSSQAFGGFLFGLGLPVAAILGEAAYEVYAALRYGY
jgi:small-conductance mechanosensitive channel